MAFPEQLDPTTPADSDSPRQGAQKIRALTQFLLDVFGITAAPSTISAACGNISSAGKFTITNGTWTGDVLGVAYGGSGVSSYTVGDLLYASGATTLAKLADVATGNALLSGGVGVAPAWGKVDLTAHVTGILPVANGGTNTTNLFGTSNTWTASQYVTATLYGSASASGNLTLDSTSSGTKGNIILAPSGGPVGVGTPTPLSTAHIKGTTNALRVETAGGAGYQFIIFSTDPAGAANYGNFQVQPGALVLQPGNNNANKLQFTTWNNGTYDANVGLVITQYGIGMGVGSPTHQLELGTDSAAKPSTNTWTIFSDARVKDLDKARPFIGGMAVLRAMPAPHYFTYNGQGGTPKGVESVGWNAQDIRGITPNMVQEGPDHLLGVNTHELQYLMFNAVRELDARLSAVER